MEGREGSRGLVLGVLRDASEIDSKRSQALISDEKEMAVEW